MKQEAIPSLHREDKDAQPHTLLSQATGTGKMKFQCHVQFYGAQGNAGPPSTAHQNTGEAEEKLLYYM